MCCLTMAFSVRYQANPALLILEGRMDGKFSKFGKKYRFWTVKKHNTWMGFQYKE